MSKVLLNIETPNGPLGPISCDSVHLTICDGADGKGGGSYGIRHGHTKALLMLDKGNISAYLSGKKIFSAESGSGFATVDNNTVTAVVEEFLQTDIVRTSG